jgi:hypothetical protein
MRNVLDRSCRENQKTHFVFSNFSENRAVYEIISKNMEKPEGGHELHHNMAHTRFMLDKQGYMQKYIILNIAFARQQRFAKASLCYVTRTLPVLFINVTAAS